MSALKKHLSPNFEQSIIFLKFSKLNPNFFDSWVFKGISKFQNSEHEVHQVGSNEACNQNFSFLALNTAELAAPLNSSENPRQRRVTDGKKIFALNSFFRYKKSWNVKICNKKKQMQTNTFHTSYVDSKNYPKLKFYWVNLQNFRAKSQISKLWAKYVLIWLKINIQSK
jgi:hypothetical protein